MNEVEFKRHLKDLVRGHHHPEQHDWEPTPEPKGKTTSTAKRGTRKTPKKK